VCEIEFPDTVTDAVDATPAVRIRSRIWIPLSFVSSIVLFEMFTALLERSLWLTVSGTITPEAATDAVVDLFLDGARRVGPAPVEA